MPSLLLQIQETVIKYAQIMSEIAHVDVEVVDENLYRVAGTGMFAAHVNQDMSSEGYVYRHLIKTGNSVVIYNPGRDALCRECPKKDTCTEEIEISMPLHLGGEIIGAIGLVGSSIDQKKLILENEKTYLELVGQIADFIVVKATELIERKKRDSLLDTLDCTINCMDQGILIMGSDEVITTANEAAKRQLNENLLEGMRADLKTTGDKLSHETEYHLVLKEKKFSVMGRLYDLRNPTKRYSKVLLFKDSKDVQKKLYEMTATVHTLSSGNIIGNSEKTGKLKTEIEKVAKSTSTVLITGESGTGKEMVATAIWNASDRKDKQFVAINCAAIPEALLESELFGYVKGAFTGADPHGRIGKFELASQGVIFLDEIGDMPLYLQAKLLRVLQERSIIRIGSNQVIPIDVRIIAATNKDLKEMMAAKKFREDLYYRLNVIPMKIDPLRERREDIPELVSYFAKRYATLFGKQLWKIDDDTMNKLICHPWYGNVRELENTVEFMINMMEEDGILNQKTLPGDFCKIGQSIASITGQMTDYTPENIAGDGFGNQLPQNAENSEAPMKSIIPLKELERREIQKAIDLYGNTTHGKKEAAHSLGIGLATLYRKLGEEL